MIFMFHGSLFCFLLVDQESLQTFLVSAERVCEMKENGQNAPYVFRKVGTGAAPGLLSSLAASSFSSSNSSGGSAAGKTNVVAAAASHQASMANLFTRTSQDVINAAIDLDCLHPSPAQFIFELSLVSVQDFMPLVRVYSCLWCVRPSNMSFVCIQPPLCVFAASSALPWPEQVERLIKIAHLRGIEERALALAQVHPWMWLSIVACIALLTTYVSCSKHFRRLC